MGISLALQIEINILVTLLHYMKNQGNTKITAIHPRGNMNVPVVNFKAVV